jgi:hypothetical protein
MSDKQDNEIISFFAILAFIAIFLTCSGCTDPGKEITPKVTSNAQVSISEELIEELTEISKWQWYKLSDRVIDTIYVAINTETGKTDSVVVRTNYLYPELNYLAWGNDQVSYTVTTSDSTIIRIFTVDYIKLEYSEFVSLKAKDDENYISPEGISGNLIKL